MNSSDTNSHSGPVPGGGEKVKSIGIKRPVFPPDDPTAEGLVIGLTCLIFAGAFMTMAFSLTTGKMIETISSGMVLLSFIVMLVKLLVVKQFEFNLPNWIFVGLGLNLLVIAVPAFFQMTLILWGVILISWIAGIIILIRNS